MRNAISYAIALALVTPPLAVYSDVAAAGGSHSVRGHTTKKGTYVPPHRQTNPDISKTNNWSSKGNVNPYTGKPGTKDPYRQPTPRSK